MATIKHKQFKGLGLSLKYIFFFFIFIDKYENNINLASIHINWLTRRPYESFLNHKIFKSSSYLILK